MNAFLLAIPIIFIRYILMRWVSKDAVERAGFFPPIEGKEQIAFYIYQITTLFLLLYLLFTTITLQTIFNGVGLILVFVGTILYIKSIMDFARPQQSGLNTQGLYHYSRNPMYVAFFVYFLGCSLVIHSFLYFIILLIFQLSVHFLIISEERWCRKAFGKEYADYMKNVRRYL